MKISIIIPVLNEADTIEQALKNLSSIAGDCCEIIVVDGGSDDNTVALAKPLVDKTITTKNSGRALQMNAGASAASGHSLLFLHCDTRLPGNFFKISKIITTARWGFFMVRLSGHSRWFRLVEAMMNIRSRVSRVATGDQGLFLSRQCFDELSGFADMAIMEDVELCKRLRRCSPPVVIGNKLVTSSRRWEKNGIVKTIVLMWWLRLLYFLGAPPDKLVSYYYS